MYKQLFRILILEVANHPTYAVYMSVMRRNSTILVHPPKRVMLPTAGGRTPSTGPDVSRGPGPSEGTRVPQDIWATLNLPATGGGVFERTIAVGSICSGMMTEHWACLRLP